MKLYDTDGRAFEAKSCTKPRFSYHRGRAWDYKNKYIDGVKVEFHYDSTWGSNFYFQFNDKWYSTSILGKGNNDGVEDIKELYTKIAKPNSLIS